MEASPGLGLAPEAPGPREGPLPARVTPFPEKRGLGEAPLLGPRLGLILWSPAPAATGGCLGAWIGPGGRAGDARAQPGTTGPSGRPRPAPDAGADASQGRWSLDLSLVPGAVSNAPTVPRRCPAPSPPPSPPSSPPGGGRRSASLWSAALAASAGLLPSWPGHKYGCCSDLPAGGGGWAGSNDVQQSDQARVHCTGASGNPCQCCQCARLISVCFVSRTLPPRAAAKGPS